ncbi:MAG: all3515 family Zur-repressed PEP-CTERM protein [Planctomycetota bacterium]
MKRFPNLGFGGLSSLLLLLAARGAHGELVNYYVAIDGGTGEPSWSAFRDQDGDGTPEIELANPNLGRLTFLYAHHIEEDPSTTHFHTLGRYSYTGELASPTVTDQNEFSFWSGDVVIQGLPGNLIPEQFAEFGETLPPLPLLPSDGMFDGKLTSIPGGVEGGTYANMEIRPTADLVPYPEGTPEHYMLRALEPFGEDYDDPLTGAVVAIELLALTPGLQIGSLTETNILSDAGDTAVMGSGDENFSFTPVFWTESDAPIGVYSATMRLVDLRTSGEAFLPSGQYTFSFAVVPEPSTVVLTVIAVVGLAGTARRTRRPV